MDWLDEGMGSGFVLGALWARTHLAQQATARARKTKACPTCHGDVHVDLAGDIWTTSNAPTDAECIAFWYAFEDAADETNIENIRAALSAARAARRGESDDSNHPG